MSEVIFGNRKLSNSLPAFVMGIVNATPDSFFEGSRGGIDYAMKLISDGADILDIGGESTRPGYTEVSEEEELERVIPLIRHIRSQSDIPISIDTRKAKVFKEAVRAGADVLNDVSCFEDDPAMLETLIKISSGVILMHRYPEDKDRIGNADTIVSEVRKYLDSKVDLLLEKNFPLSKIIVDPGIGFGKTPEEDLEIMRRLDELKTLDGNEISLMVGVSRKNFIGWATGLPLDQRDEATGAACVWAIAKGVDIIRVHNVKMVSRMRLMSDKLREVFL